MLQIIHRYLFIVSPWVMLAGMLQYHFRSLLPGQRIFTGLEFFDFITVLDIFVGILFVVIFIGLFFGKIKIVDNIALPLEWKLATGLLLLAAVVQFLFQQVYEPVLSTPFEYFRSFFVFPLIFMVMAFRTLDWETVRALLKSYLLMVGVFCIFALVQYFTGWFPGEQHDFMGRMVWPFVDFVTLKSSSANWVAFFVTPAFILSFAHVINARKERWFYVLVMILAGICLYMTQSYGAYAAAFIAVLFYLFRVLPLKKFAIGFIVMLILAGGAYLHQQTTWKYQVFVGDEDYRFASSVASRGDIFKMNLHMISSNPLLGVGMNQYQSYFAANQISALGHELNESHIPPHAHNFFLSFYTSLGLLGFLAMFVLVVGIFWRSKFDYDNPAVFVLVAIMIHGLIDSYYWKQEVVYMFWMIVMFAYLYRLDKRVK